jgi:dTDP-L-rhamnose 4-epimerase
LTKKNILITGGAGFIGSHLADALLTRGHFVRVLDNLSPPVHGKGASRPAYLDPRVDLVVGDIRDGAAVDRALVDIDAVYHLAAAVGAGQSMCAVERYTSVNNLGTAVIMDRLIHRPVERLVVASTMTVYGEGLYLDESGASCEVGSRTTEQLDRAEWDPRVCGRHIAPAATPETKSVKLESVYALSKFDQERMCLALGRAYGIPTVVLRLFNVYGARQSLANPYTGVLATFVSRLLQGERPLVYEDGAQRRDFVSVHDVVRAFVASLDSDAAPGMVLNVGSGASRTIVEVAKMLARLVGKPHLTPDLTGEYQIGDVRHCWADIRRAEKVLGYRPTTAFDTGLGELARWFGGRSSTGAPSASSLVSARSVRDTVNVPHGARP